MSKDRSTELPKGNEVQIEAEKEEATKVLAREEAEKEEAGKVLVREQAETDELAKIDARIEAEKVEVEKVEAREQAETEELGKIRDRELAESEEVTKVEARKLAEEDEEVKVQARETAADNTGSKTKKLTLKDLIKGTPLAQFEGRREMLLDPADDNSALLERIVGFVKDSPGNLILKSYTTSYNEDNIRFLTAITYETPNKSSIKLEWGDKGYKITGAENVS